MVEPAGFRIGDSRFRRAVMDYRDAVSITVHDSWEKFEAWREGTRRRLVLLTTKGETSMWDFAFRQGDVVLVGRNPRESLQTWRPPRMRNYAFPSAPRSAR